MRKKICIKGDEFSKIEDIQLTIIELIEEDQAFAGEIRVAFYDIDKNETILSHIYDMSEDAVNVLKEIYGCRNVELITEGREVPTPNPLERIAAALERIQQELGCISGSLERLEVVADCINEFDQFKISAEALVR